MKSLNCTLCLRSLLSLSAYSCSCTFSILSFHCSFFRCAFIYNRYFPFNFSNIRCLWTSKSWSQILFFNITKSSRYKWIFQCIFFFILFCNLLRKSTQALWCLSYMPKALCKLLNTASSSWKWNRWYFWRFWICWVLINMDLCSLSFKLNIRKCFS